MKIQLENKRIEFVQYYTPERILALAKEEYVIGLGSSNKSFCYQLEYDLNDLGSIRGNNSGKFGIWFGKHGTDQEHCYRFNPKFGTDFEQAFQTAKQEIVKLIEAGANDDYDQILKSRFSPMVRGKILYIYHPEKYMPIYSEDYLRHFIDILGIVTCEKDHISMQQNLLSYKVQNSATKKMTNYDFYLYLNKNYGYKKMVDVDAYDEEMTNYWIANSKEKIEISDFVDEPVEKKKPLKRYGKRYYPRNEQYSKIALALADYSCEYNPEHKSFIKKANGKPYTEAHHLVPMCKEGNKQFVGGLDVPANIVSLCSECHKRIHYGKDIEEVIIKLYNIRKERLRDANIEISLEELLNFYGL